MSKKNAKKRYKLLRFMKSILFNIITLYEALLDEVEGKNKE